MSDDIYPGTVIFIDAIHAATMNINQIKNMATNDRDFERIEWIKIWKP